MRKIAAVALMAVLSSGCATQTYLISPQSQTNVKADHEEMQTFFVNGLGQQQEVNATEVCKGQNNVAKIETEQNLLNGVLGFLTSGIYTPRQFRVYCK